MKLQVLAALALAGCFYGGGGVVGYGQRGLVYGGEITGGLPVMALAAGYQSTGHAYVNAGIDAIADQGTPHVTTVGYALGSVRVAGGVSFDEAGAGGMVLAGGGLGTGLRDAQVGYQSGECNDKWSDELNVTVEVRYIGQWEIVAVPRYERINITCEGH